MVKYVQKEQIKDPDKTASLGESDQEQYCLLRSRCPKVWEHQGMLLSACRYELYYLSRVVRKPGFCICENKDADQLRGKREADQRLCSRYIDSTIPLLSKSEISSL